MRIIDVWVKRHPFLSKLALWVGGLLFFTGGPWLLVNWLMGRPHPDTAEAHIYCAVIATGPDGRLDEAKANEELTLSKKLAYEQGGEAGVRQAARLALHVTEEESKAIEYGAYDMVRQRYAQKCLGY